MSFARKIARKRMLAETPPGIVARPDAAPPLVDDVARPDDERRLPTAAELDDLRALVKASYARELEKLARQRRGWR